jgi:ABC-type molybdate transport system substrate-binding protein
VTPSRLAALLAAAVLLLSACDASAPAPVATESPSANPNAGVVRVAAASSLAAVLGTQKAAIEAANPGLRVALSFGPSQAFAAQAPSGGIVARWLTNADGARARAQYGFEPAATP